jgi:YHS domain-containing protein
MNYWRLFAVVLAVASVLGCGGKEKTQPSVQDAAQAVAAQAASISAVEDYLPTQDQYGTVTSCPVMGEKVTVGKDTIAVKYKGKAYFLCCPSCVGQFKSNPEKYAK